MPTACEDSRDQLALLCMDELWSLPAAAARADGGGLCGTPLGQLSYGVRSYKRRHNAAQHLWRRCPSAQTHFYAASAATSAAEQRRGTGAGAAHVRRRMLLLTERSLVANRIRK